MKRPRMACVIHCSDETSDNLVSLQSLDSWKSLLRAAEIRQHVPTLELVRGLAEGEIPPVQYHRKCRSIFTMKKLLDSITKRTGTVEPTAERSRRSSGDVPCTSRVFDKQCIFCEKSSKYLKGQTSREPLIQCSELRADDWVWKAAVSKQDQRMLAITSRELVAAEGHYHRSCYRAYTRGESADTWYSGTRWRSRGTIWSCRAVRLWQTFLVHKEWTLPEPTNTTHDRSHGNAIVNNE